MTERHRAGEDWAGLLPGILTLVWLAPLFFAPFALVLAYSFATQDYLTGDISFGWTLSAWHKLNDPIVLAALGRSIVAAGTTTLGTALIGYPMAYFIARHAGRFQGLALVLVIVPFWVSFIVRAYAWIDLLVDRGIVNRLLLDLGLIARPIPLVYNLTGIVIGLVYGYLPLMVFPIYASLRAVDPKVLEAARDLGANWWTAFWRVTFPQASPGLVAGMTIVFVPALGDFAVPLILGGGKLFLFGNLIALRFTRFTWPEGSALVIGVLVLVLVNIAIATVMVGRKRFAAAVAR